MSKQQFIKSAILGGLVVGTLTFGSFKANAVELNQNVAQDGKVMLPIKFGDGLEKTSPNQVANICDKPDEIIAYRVWILI